MGEALTNAEAAQEQTAKATRPVAVPDAEKEPDAFMAWGEKRLREVAERKNAEELSLVFEQEVMAFADGLMKPDVDALTALHDKLLAKIGG